MMTGSVIHELRKKNGLTQEQLAEQMYVSRQAVQKWESDITLPEVDKLVALSKLFNVAVDSLLCLEDRRTTEELRLERQILPTYQSIHHWESYPDQLMVEYIQCIDEGKNLEKMKPLFDAIYAMEAGNERERMSDILFSLICKAPIVEGYPYTEPSDLEGIQMMRKDFGLRYPSVSPDVLRDKIKGAWLGRICGCLLGKPIEGIRLVELNRLMRDSGNYPLHRYFRKTDISEEIQNTFKFNFRNRCFIDTIEIAPVDDDTNYTVLAGMLIEKYGRDFTPADVGRTWLELQPKSAYCTAERVAFKNLVNGYQPPETAIYKNPYREWIGAQIRADYFGYVNPGNPEAAADMAWRDASLSHIKNGIYGEMFAAAMLAGAASLNTAEEVLLCGLSQIPKTSRLYKEVFGILEEYRAGSDYDKCFAGICTRYNDMSGHDWCHTISNAAIVAAALLYGNCDYGKSICLAVQSGFDTDCNGATVGSVVGMMKGSDSIASEWSAPIHNTLDTSIFGVGKVTVDQMVEMTMKHIAH